MAKFIKCDTCEAVSPDENGLYVANHWHVVTVNVSMYPDKKDEYLVCGDCMIKGVRLSADGVKS